MHKAALCLVVPMMLVATFAFSQTSSIQLSISQPENGDVVPRRLNVSVPLQAWERTRSSYLSIHHLPRGGSFKDRHVSHVSYPGFPICLPQMAPLYTREPPSARNSVRRTIVQLQRPSPQPTALVRGCGQAYALQTVEPVTSRCGTRRVCQARSSGSERYTRARPHAVAPMNCVPEDSRRRSTCTGRTHSPRARADGNQTPSSTVAVRAPSPS